MCRWQPCPHGSPDESRSDLAQRIPRPGSLSRHKVSILHVYIGADHAWQCKGRGHERDRAFRFGCLGYASFLRDSLRSSRGITVLSLKGACSSSAHKMGVSGWTNGDTAPTPRIIPSFGGVSVSYTRCLACLSRSHELDFKIGPTNLHVLDFVLPTSNGDWESGTRGKRPKCHLSLRRLFCRSGSQPLSASSRVSPGFGSNVTGEVDTTVINAAILWSATRRASAPNAAQPFRMRCAHNYSA